MARKPPRSKKLEYENRIVRSIRRVIRAVDLYSHKLAVEAGVTAPQLACLLRLVEEGPLTLKGLAAEVELSASTLVGIVDRLEAKELVTRQRSQTDRRRVMISATEKGAVLAAAAPSPLQDRLSAALDRLPRLEQAALAQSLERIVELMEIGQVDAAPILDTGVSLRADPSKEIPTKSEREKRAVSKSVAAPSAATSTNG